MTQCWQRRDFQLALASSMLVGGAIAYKGDCAFAQIAPDGTLPNNSIVTPSGNTSLIEGGTRAGSNLFHSFEQFSVPTGGAAYFNNALDIQNIISRVTGGSISNIDGLIQANASANLFLLNPNGIIFGPNASLNIGGSFLASTASNINFADDTQFSAKAPETTPLLTVSVPIGLQIGATAGDIRVQSSALAVPPGKNLTLVGSEVEFEEGSLTPARGLIEIDTGSTEVSLSQIVPDATLPVNSIVTPQGNASMITGGTVAGSNLFHTFEQFSVLTGSTAYFNNALDVQNIIARVTGSSASNIDGSIAANGIANLFLLNPNGIIFGPNAKLDIGGSILVSTASSLNFADGTSFSATAHSTTPLLSVSVPIGLQFGETVGDIRLQDSDLKVQPGKTLALVGGDVTLKGGAEETYLNLAYSSLVALGGRIELGSVAGVGEVSLIQRGNTWVLGYDLVDAFGDISLERGAVNVSGEGGGSIQIQSAKLEMTQGASISANTTGTGTGGEVLIKTTEAITLSDDSEISSNVFGSGTAGSLRIETGKLIVRDGSRVSAAINGKGQEGTLTVSAKDSVELSGTGSGLFTEIQRFVGTSIGLEPMGQPTKSTAFINSPAGVGELTITTEQGETLTTIVGVAAEETGQGIVGDLALITEQGETLTVSALGAAELISVTSNSRVSASIEGFSNGRAVGDLTIETGKLIVRDGAAVSTATYGKGRGGNLTVRARESVELMGSSSLNTSTSATGAAGDLTIATGNLSVGDGAQVNVSSQGSARAGNLEVEADSIRLDNQALLSADTKAGQGNIFLRSKDLVLRRGSNITTNATGTATGGNITIDTGVIASARK